ncbi:MAG: histidinol dehydrogenase, partial [Gaiellales bacterium]
MSGLTVHVLATMSADDRRRVMERSTAEIFDPELVESIGELVRDVRDRGDAALVDALARFDEVTCPPEALRVGPEEFEAARSIVSTELVDAVRLGVDNVRAFNEQIARRASWTHEIAPGHVVGEQAGPIDAAGLFVPSGK